MRDYTTPYGMNSQSYLRVASTEHADGLASIEYWREVICNVHMPADFEALGGHSYDGLIKTFDVEGYRLSAFDTSPARIQRTKQRISQDNVHDFGLVVPVRGAFEVCQMGRTHICKPGDASLIDMSEPFTFVQDETIACVGLRIPRDELSSRVPFPQDICLLNLDAREELIGIATTALVSLAGLVEEDRIGTSASALKAINELLLTALSSAYHTQTKRPFARHSDTRRLTLNRASSFIERNLRLEDLSPTLVAEHCGISTSYLHELFRPTGQTVGRYIVKARLRSARAALSEVTQASKTISQIAIALGFSDLSHFSSAFKSEFGMSPRSARRSSRN